MKTWIYILLLFPAPALLAQGIALKEMPFEEALRQAGEQNKLLFVDFYTEWCMPCREMARRLESEQAAADFFNPRFVTVKYDLERGEGKTLRDRFNVTGIPSYFIFAPDGTELYRRTGALPLQEFIERIAAGADPRNAISIMEKEWREGHATKERTMNYLNFLIEGGRVEQSVQVAAALLDALTDEEKLSPLYWPAFRDRYITPSASSNMLFFLKHLDRFRENVPAKEIDRKIEENFYPLNGFLAGHEVEGGLPLLDALQEIIRVYDLPDKARLDARARLSRAFVNGDVDEITALVERHLPGETLSPWQCEKALELVAARGDSAAKSRLARLAKRLSEDAGEPRREQINRLFREFL